VAFALWLVGAIKYTRLGFYIVAQLTGGIVASVIVKALSPGIQAYKCVNEGSASSEFF
jgi:glycerol uptake facilitator-like aquaporin